MPFWEIFGLILGSSVVGAIITQFGNILINRLQHKDKKEERAEDAAAKLDEDRLQFQKRISALETSVGDLAVNYTAVLTMMEVYSAALRASISERLFYLCSSALSQKSIKFTERKQLLMLHDAYESLGGNGDFNDLIDRIKKLDLIMDD